MHVDAVETARTAIYLNAALAGSPIERFWGDGTCFVSVNGRVLADNPEQWLNIQRPCRGFRIRRRSGRIASQLPVWFQASHWVLKVLTADEEIAWRASYDVRADPASARRLWLVTYRPETGGNDIPVQGRDLRNIAEGLESTLQRLIELTGSRIPAWQRTFVGLLAKLNGSKPVQLAPPILPEVLSELPARLVNTAFAANIFTGMGNWGDNIYDPDIQPTVESLTASVFTLLAEGLQGAVESTLPLEHRRS